MGYLFLLSRKDDALFFLAIDRWNRISSLSNYYQFLKLIRKRDNLVELFQSDRTIILVNADYAEKHFYRYDICEKYSEEPLIQVDEGYLVCNKCLKEEYELIDGSYVMQVLQTPDDGYIVVGSTMSMVTYDNNFYVVKTNSLGDTLWTNTYGGNDYEDAGSIDMTSDGGYIIAGFTFSYTTGYYYAYVVKTDSLGDTLWTRTYGEGVVNIAYSVQQTTDNGYIIAGTSGPDEDIREAYLVKTDSLGDTLWTRTYGVGITVNDAMSVQQTSDGGYIIAGNANIGIGNCDMYIVKTDSLGDTLWTRTYGGSELECAWSVDQTTDGGYIVAGFTTSYGAGENDFYVLKLDAYGDTLWTHTYGEYERDKAMSVQQTTDGGYIVAGWSRSFEPGAPDIYNAWLVKIVGEDIPLTPPQNLFVTEEGYATWDAPSSEDLLGYNVYIDSVFVEYTTDLFHQYTNLTNSQIYLAGISALYDEGESEIIEFEFVPVLDPPQNLNVVCIEDHAHFTWEAPTVDGKFSKQKTKAGEENTRDLTGYNVYLDQVEVATNIPDLEYDFYDLINDEYYDAGIKAIYDEGTSELIEINFQYTGTGVENILPLITELNGNYPNPFNPITIINYSLAEESNIELIVFNIKGQNVKTLINEKLPAGNHQVMWDSKDENSKPVSSGIYFYKMNTNNYTSTKKMILMK